MKNSSNEMTYYNRKMKCDFVEKLTKDYPWLISFVKEHDCLDFQTGYNPKTKRSWLSIYKGTGRILTFISSKKGISCDAANKYKELYHDFFGMPTKEKFEIYLGKIKKRTFLKDIITMKRINETRDIFKIS